MNPKPWRDHTDLHGRFASEYPDDTQILIHNGSPRFSNQVPELVWVRVESLSQHETGIDVFCGSLLNTPNHLSVIHKGDTIEFISGRGCPYPIMVTKTYLAERAVWNIIPCDKCGCAELFDAPSELLPKVFPNLPDGAILEAFTSFCPLCGGAQVVSHPDTFNGESTATTTTKRWWQFWK